MVQIAAYIALITHDYSQHEILDGATNKIYIKKEDIDEVLIDTLCHIQYVQSHTQIAS